MFNWTAIPLLFHTAASTTEPFILIMGPAFLLTTCWRPCFVLFYYRGADNSLARPWKETSYSDQDLWLTNNSNIFLLFVRHKSWYSVVSLGRCSLSPSRVGLKTYQNPGNYLVTTVSTSSSSLKLVTVMILLQRWKRVMTARRRIPPTYSQSMLVS